MSANFGHHIKGDGGCQFSKGFWLFKVQMRKSIAGIRVKKRNVLTKIIFVSTNLFGRFGESVEEILAEQVVCFYMTCSILVRN